MGDLGQVTRINAIAQLGGVVRVMAEGRGGVIIERFRTADGQDCTQSITKLQRCGLVDPYALSREFTDDLRKVMHTRFVRKLIKGLNK